MQGLGKLKLDLAALKYGVIVDEKTIIDIFDFQNNSLQVTCHFDTALEYREKRDTDLTISTSNLSFAPWKKLDVAQFHDRPSFILSKSKNNKNSLIENKTGNNPNSKSV